MSQSNLKQVTVSRGLSMSREAAWQRMRDFSIAHHYVPGIVQTEILTTEKRNVGATRRVYSSRNRWIDETVIEWNEGSGFLLDLHPGQGDSGSAPFPFAEAKFRYALKDSSRADICVCSLTLYYRIRGSALMAWLGGLLLAPLMRSNLRKVSRRMKIFYETGKSQQFK